MAGTSNPPVRVLAIADSDSYLKWSLATVQALPRDWVATQLVIANPLRPSTGQTSAAGLAHVEVVNRSRLLRRIGRERPDVVLLACTGPVVAALTTSPVLRGRGRPVLVTGLPGISVPASRGVLEHRAGCDLLILHSHREVADFTVLAAAIPVDLTFGLATLPFLRKRVETLPDLTADRGVVFAAQAAVPSERSQREAILFALADCGSAVVKLRAAAGERQTHDEIWSYPQLLGDLVASGRVASDAVWFRTGPMDKTLRSATGLVTVSSTAALEALAAGVPILILSDFGVNAKMINQVFDGSGCLGTLADLRKSRFHRPDDAWSTANYFHPSTDNNWLPQLRSLIKSRRAGLLPMRSPFRMPEWADLRRRLRLLAPARSVAQWWYGHRGRSTSEPAAHDHKAPVRPPGRRLG
jgi:hypothetical protein